MTDTDRSPEALVLARQQVRNDLGAGNLCVAYDHAVSALKDWPDDIDLKFRSVLALARAGATDLAIDWFAKTGLATASDLPEPFDIDVPALAARMKKDIALGAAGTSQRDLLRAAADAYREVYEHHVKKRPGGASHPAVNAAALSLWAGDREQASQMADATLAALPADVIANGDYWAVVTRAEALLVLGDADGAAAMITAAREKLQADRRLGWTDVATTRRQLRRTCLAQGFDAALLAPLSPPMVIAYCGHMIGKRFDARNEGAVAAAIAQRLDELRVVAGYGSLAGGSDILFAEALLERKAELHVVLPYDKSDFIVQSVTSCGPGWEERFATCLERASSLRYATEDRFLHEDMVYHYNSRVAFGHALLRAERLDAPIRLLAMWDGKPPAPSAVAGASTDVGLWSTLGHPLDVISPRGELRCDVKAQSWRPPPLEGGRINAAILFGDIRGFSALREIHLVSYVDNVLGTIARVLEAREKHVLTCNTWGDAFFAVIDDVGEAAGCALDIQQALADLDPAQHGLPERMSMRIGAHFGPVRPVFDPVQRRQAYMGFQVVRAARIEPVAQPGMVWVTEGFAAALALKPRSGYACDYLGQVDLAKAFGRQPLYRLHAQSTVESAA